MLRFPVMDCTTSTLEQLKTVPGQLQAERVPHIASARPTNNDLVQEADFLLGELSGINDVAVEYLCRQPAVDDWYYDLSSHQSPPAQQQLTDNTEAFMLREISQKIQNYQVNSESTSGKRKYGNKNQTISLTSAKKQKLHRHSHRSPQPQEITVRQNANKGDVIAIRSTTASTTISCHPTPVSTFHPTPVSNIHTTPVSTVRPTPVSSVRSTPVSTFRPIPVSNIHRTPVSTVRPTPVSSVRPTPVSTVRPIPLSAVRPTSVSSFHPTPVSNIHRTPVSAVRPTPVSTFRPIPVSTFHSTPVSNIHTTPVSTVRPTPVSSICPTPASTFRRIPVSTVHPSPVSTVSTSLPTPLSTVRPIPVSAIRPIPVPTIHPTSVSSIQSTPVSTVRPTHVSTVRPTSVSTFRPTPVSTTTRDKIISNPQRENSSHKLEDIFLEIEDEIWDLSKVSHCYSNPGESGQEEALDLSTVQYNEVLNARYEMITPPCEEMTERRKPSTINCQYETLSPPAQEVAERRKPSTMNCQYETVSPPAQEVPQSPGLGRDFATASPCFYETQFKTFSPHHISGSKVCAYRSFNSKPQAANYPQRYQGNRFVMKNRTLSYPYYSYHHVPWIL